MADAVTVATIADHVFSVISAVAATVAVVIGLHNKAGLRKNNDQLESIHVEFNSKMDAYLKTRQDLADTKESAAYAKGKEDQRTMEVK